MRIEQNSNEGEHSINMTAAHLPLMREVNRALGPAMNKGRMRFAVREMPWLVALLESDRDLVVVALVVMGLTNEIHAIT